MDRRNSEEVRVKCEPEKKKTRYEGTSFAVKAGAVDQKVEVMHPVTKEHYELNIKESVDERSRGSGYGRAEISGACFEDYV